MKATQFTSRLFAHTLLVLGYLSLQTVASGERNVFVPFEQDLVIPKEIELFVPEKPEEPGEPAEPENPGLGERELAPLEPREPREPGFRPKLFDVEVGLAGEGELLIRVTSLHDHKPILWISDDLKDWEPLAMGQAGAEPVYLFLVQSSAQAQRFFRVSSFKDLPREIAVIEEGNADDNGGTILEREELKIVTGPEGGIKGPHLVEVIKEKDESDDDE